MPLSVPREVKAKKLQQKNLFNVHSQENRGVFGSTGGAAHIGCQGNTTSEHHLNVNTSG